MMDPMKFEFICTVPHGTRLCAYKGLVIAAGPGLRASIVTPHGLVPVPTLEGNVLAALQLDSPANRA